MWQLSPSTVVGQPPTTDDGARGSDDASNEFKKTIRPMLSKYCFRCHDAKQAMSDVNLSVLDREFKNEHLFLLDEMLEQVSSNSMPPEDELQPSKSERRRLTQWIEHALLRMKARDAEKNGSVRRLTVDQYQNALSDLLGLRENLTDILPPDAVSRDGFLNNEQSMVLSPLLIEAYLEIADEALSLCLVDKNERPTIQTFRMDLGKSINPEPCPDKLILGANSLLLANDDFVVRELTPTKPFDFDALSMKKSFEFIEGYQGNATVRGWRKFGSIYHAVFACVRGTRGYPAGEPYEVGEDGLLLRPAIPSPEIFGRSSTYGPMANFKISLRELPDQGNFRVTVRAARYDDGLLLGQDADFQDEEDELAIDGGKLRDGMTSEVSIPRDGIYQIEVDFSPAPKAKLSLSLGTRVFSGQLKPTKSKRSPEQLKLKEGERRAAFMQVRLPAGKLPLKIDAAGDSRLSQIRFVRLDDESDAARRFKTFERRTPSLGVYMGLRRDCGSTLAQVGKITPMDSNKLTEFVFEGAIGNYPTPDVEEGNVNYLAGIREIGIRSEYTDGRNMPRLLVRSVEFEGPYYSSWPPKKHRMIFIESANRDNPAQYASEVIRAFAERAYRRPISDMEHEFLTGVWLDAYESNNDFQQSIKDTLLVVLTSPQFLFVIEQSGGPKLEVLDEYELASKLSFFLWNTSPNERLLRLAANDGLHKSLDDEIDRMILDPRFIQFARPFTSQWLSLDKFDVVEIDHRRYPRLTRDVRTHLREEPVQLVQHLLRRNLPLSNLIRSDFIMANEPVADYYGLADKTESGLRFAPIEHRDENLGGLLSQASLLAGLSDGRQANPVKRGAWLARKILAEPPADPPPNVPGIDEDDESLSLRERLERHRNQSACANCHANIDPWGIPSQAFDAGGLFQQDSNEDPSSTLPDGAEVKDLNGLKDYLVDDRLDQVAFSFLKHAATYAVGRDLKYNEIAFLKEKGIELKPSGYRMRDMLRFVIKSKIFLTK